MVAYHKKSVDFFKAVYDITRLIPQGRVTSYGAIAKSISLPKASRMVGWTLSQSISKTPVVPAHRVVNRIGRLTGKNHFPNPNTMQELLESEGIEVIDDKVVRFKELFWDPQAEL